MKIEFLPVFVWQREKMANRILFGYLFCSLVRVFQASSCLKGTAKDATTKDDNNSNNYYLQRDEKNFT